ncbi:MAG: HlyD family efflux transporter periplasmic adaptor subunit [Eubacteriales bacterium]|nr:HlyD family efflux transporter periplasmic adaptor subunit [Eubacteriales bacterium]
MKRKKLAVIGLSVMVVAGGAAATCFYLYTQPAGQEQMPTLPEGMSLSENAVSASGLTGVGMREESWELGFLEEGLYVEETYLNMGDQVEADTPVFKVSQDSLEDAEKELERAATEAELNRRQGEIDYQTGLAEAEIQKKLSAAEAEYAQAVYDDAVAQAQEQLDSVQEKVDEAQEKVDEYTASIEEDYYYTYYEVGELEATWKDYAAFLMELYNEWDVESLESVFGGSGGKNGIGYVTNNAAAGTSGGISSAQAAGNAAAQESDVQEIPAAYYSTETVKTTEESPEEEDTGGDSGEGDGSGEEGDGSGGGTTPPDPGAGGMPEMPEGMEMSEGMDLEGRIPTVQVGSDEIRYNIYLAMEEEAEEQEAAYEEALESYEEARDAAAAGIEKAKSELKVLQAQLAEQKIAYEEAVIAARETYEIAAAENESAQTVYETTVKQLEEEYQTLKDEEETASQNLEDFREVIGDGVFYTSEAGTVMMTSVRAGSWLTEDSMVLAYTSPDTVSVSADVDQSDIAKIEIGDEAVAVISGYGVFEGKVTSFNPVSETAGSASVTYTVNVELEGDVSELEANLTAYVYFGLTEEEKEALTAANTGGQVSGNEVQELPEGMEAPEDFQGMPEGEGMPEGMNMPEGGGAFGAGAPGTGEGDAE